MTQTAVLWLEKELLKNGYVNKGYYNQDSLNHLENLFEQAKEMEKEQMNLSEIKGISNTINYKNSLAEISDNEIEKAAAHYEPMVTRRAWVSACKWYREQLKQRQ